MTKPMDKFSRRQFLQVAPLAMSTAGLGLTAELVYSGREQASKNQLVEALAGLETVNTLKDSIPEEDISTVLSIHRALMEKFAQMPEADLVTLYQIRRAPEAPKQPRSFAKREDEKPVSSKGHDPRLG